MAHAWPGNVRELRNVVERAFIACEGDVITAKILPAHLPGGAGGAWSGDSDILTSPIGLPLREVEKQFVLRTLAAENNNKTRAADRLGDQHQDAPQHAAALGTPAPADPAGVDLIGEMRARVSEQTQDVRARLDRLEQGVTRLAEGPERALLVETVQALRETVERLEGVERDERHQLGHDLRVPLNAIAGWTHILRLDATSAATVNRAVDVFDRNVRALTRLIESYTSEDSER